MRTEIKDYAGRIIGFVSTDSTGNKEIFDKYGRKLGSYDKNLDYTKDRYGRIVARGENLSMLLIQ